MWVRFKVSKDRRGKMAGRVVQVRQGMSNGCAISHPTSTLFIRLVPLPNKKHQQHILGTLHSGFHYKYSTLLISSTVLWGGFNSTHILQRRKLRLWEVKSPVKDYTVDCQHPKSVRFPLEQSASSQCPSTAFPSSKVQFQVHLFQEAFPDPPQRPVISLSRTYLQGYHSLSMPRGLGTLLKALYVVQYSKGPRSHIPWWHPFYTWKQ